MRRYRIRISFIGGALDRSKKVHIHISRYNHDTGGMLSRGALRPQTAVDDTLNKSPPLFLAPFFKIFSHIPIRCLICHSRYGTGTIRIILAEKFSSIFLRLCLVNAGKIQINIGHLIAVET